MKVTDLRIGNAIKINGVKTPNIGYSILQDIAQKDKGIKNEYLNTLSFEPIKLNKKELGRLGFDYNEGEWTDSYEEFTIEKHMFREKYNVYGYKDEFITFVKYVHDLQNLIYAITKEEIKYE